MLDTVTLVRYTTGTVKNCDSAAAQAGRPPFLLASGGWFLAGKKRRSSNRSRELTLISGKQPQLRKASAKSWNKSKEEVFLSTLAETCNVTRACEAAGVGVTSVYRRKKETAGFRAAWLAALSIAYQQLELILLERAFNGTEKLVSVRAGEARTMREYSNQLGIALLKMHRDSATDAEFELPPDEMEEVRARLLRKLERLEERDAQECATPG